MNPVNRWLKLGSSIIMGGSAALLGLSAPAIASDELVLRYNAETITISTDELRSFIETGIVPDDLQTFFNTTEQVSQDVSRYLGEEIRIPDFVDEFLASSNGEFVLLKLDEVVSGSSDLTDLETAINAAAEDDLVSMIEIFEEYPASEITVNLNEIEPIYNDVKNFVERVLPALDVARDFLQDVLCDCESVDDDTAESDDADLESQLPNSEGDRTVVATTCHPRGQAEASPIQPVSTELTTASDAASF